MCLGIKKKVSRSLGDYYSIKFDKDVLAKWNELKASLYTEKGVEPSLIYKFEKPHVYFVQNEINKEIKIGVSIHPELRKKQLANSKNLKLLKIIDSGDYKLERELHFMFRKYNTKGEWFLENKELLKYIKEN